MHQRFTNKIHLPAERWQQLQLFFLQFFLIPLVGGSSKKLDEVVKLFSKATNVPIR
jgi:hypothetical protein